MAADVGYKGSQSICKYGIDGLTLRMLSFSEGT